ncbi:MAG: hypothetical protein E6J90_37850 [Deltaproteobacteria bacterium]|nr:MAG: hypothetical protein E6J90_37850 [Deltaproteobacteria bacterium]
MQDIAAAMPEINKMPVRVSRWFMALLLGFAAAQAAVVPGRNPPRSLRIERLVDGTAGLLGDASSRQGAASAQPAMPCLRNSRRK